MKTIAAMLGKPQLAADPRREAAPTRVYQFKITLRHLEPPVWRRFQVPNYISPGQLHDAIQTVMGWTHGALRKAVCIRG